MENHFNSHPENRGAIVHYSQKWDHYYVKVENVDSIIQEIYYCPWCGLKLPLSRRDAWFDALEKLGIDPVQNPELVPREFKSSQWWEVK
jgi:hypothetical protein